MAATACDLILGIRLLSKERESVLLIVSEFRLTPDSLCIGVATVEVALGRG